MSLSVNTHICKLLIFIYPNIPPTNVPFYRSVYFYSAHYSNEHMRVLLCVFFFLLFLNLQGIESIKVNKIILQKQLKGKKVKN